MKINIPKGLFRAVMNLGFSDQTIQAVWEKGNMVQNVDPNIWRKDRCGAWINRSEYGKETNYGWEVDHITPLARGGSDSLSNLQPLQWKNNRAKADGRQECPVRSDGSRNIGV